MTLIAAFLTALYTWRLMFFTFEGNFRGGKAMAAHVHDPPWTMAVPMAILAAGATGAAVSAAVGLPALRVRGLQLAIATLAFALATSSWLLPQDWAFGSGRSTRPIELFGHKQDRITDLFSVQSLERKLPQPPVVWIDRLTSTGIGMRGTRLIGV